MADQPVVLVTGASRGIGLHLVGHFLARGFAVVGCSRGETAPLDDERYFHVRADVAVESDVVRLFERIRMRFGRLDVAINNAAVNPAIGLSLRVSHAVACQTMTTNVVGPLVVSREAAKLMMRRSFGRIVNFGSMAVRHEVAGEAVYSASKAALLTLTRVMAKELFRYGITCNMVAPSAIETDMMAAVPRPALDEVLARNAIPSVGTMDDVTNAVDWLIRPESQAVTGQVIYLGGT